MKLPLLSWNKTIRNLGFRVIRRPQSFKAATKTKLRKKEADQQTYGPLEPRQMLAGDTGLAIQANLNQLLDTFDDPIVVRTGQFDNNTSWDAAVLSSSGNLTIATNGDDGTWQNRRTVDLGVGPLNGLEVARVNNDIFADLILQGPDGIYVAAGDGEGNFAVTQTLSPLAAGALAASNNGNPALDIAVGIFDGDANQDLVALSPSTGQVVFYAGNGDGTFASPVLESTGALAPISITTGDFVGGGFPDLAIGHEGGEVTFLENKGNGDFELRPELTVSGFSAVKDLSSADVDDDGDTDIVVASGDDLTILQNSKSQTDLSPVIDNGTFGRGLSDWNVEVVGERTPDAAGRVIAQSGFAQLVENESFLVSINQSIVIPVAPEDLKVDLLSVGLEDPDGGIPDAFEISILDESGNSLVPTFQSNATSFFNINPGNVVSTAAGVTFDGTTVTLDISGIPAGTQATVYFDLIGNGPGSGSTVTIDDVRVTPENEFVTRFDAATLAGPFTDVNQISIADVDGDGRLDIAASDAGTSQVLVFNGQGGLVFDREEIAVPGTGLVSLDTAPLTAGDTISDIVVVAQDNDLLISPLVGDRMVPTVELLRPVANTTGTDTVNQIELQFSEPMRVTSSTSDDSVTFVGNYELRGLGADGIADTADDVVIAIQTLTYDVDSGLLVLVPDAGAAPLADGTYVVTLESSRLADTSENLLNNGVPVEFSFAVNSQIAQFAPLSTISASEGSVVEIAANFTDVAGASPYTATIDWGDGTITNVDTVEFSAGAGTVLGSHAYADNGQYDIAVTLTDNNATAAQVQTTATIENADPAPILGPFVIDVFQGQAFDGLLATFYDVGFTNITAGTAETFSASIDWGDGTTTSNAAIEVVQGAIGAATVVRISGNHTYATTGEFTATVTVADDDGGTATSEILFSVADTAPVIQPLAEINASEGDSVTLQATFADQTASTSYTATVDWGDGLTTNATVNVSEGTGTVEASHVYADNGQYTATVVLSDAAGTTAQAQTVASIANSAPTLAPIPAGSITAGAEFSINQIAFTDSGFTNSIASTTETFTASVDWGDGVTSTATIAFTAGSPGVLTTGTLDAQHTFTSAGTFSVTVTLTDDDGGSTSQTFSVSVAPVVQNENAWLPSIDFDSDAIGNGLTRGETVTDQWAAWGVHITTHDPVNHPAMIFDSAQPTGGDQDLGSPNESFGGPGVGSGGQNNSPFANSIAQNNVLIISEDNDASDPDDNASGGTFIFNFDNAVMLDEIRLLDIDHGESLFVRLYDAAGAEISNTSSVGSSGGNGFHVVDLSATGVARMEVELTGSGAITDVIFCREDHADSATINGAATIPEGSSYDLALNAGTQNLAGWVVNWGDGTVENVAAGTTSVSHLFADGASVVRPIAFATATDGSVYRTNRLTVQVQNVAPELAIGGDAAVQAHSPYTLNLTSADPGLDTITDWVVDWGDGTDPQQISGNPDTVTHVYTEAGDYSIVATAVDEDSSTIQAPSALQIRARGSEGAEQFDLQIDGITVASYKATTNDQTFTYNSASPLSASQIRIVFTNDVYDPANGIDNNLIVDFINLDGQTYQTESPDVFSTGTWKPEDGIQPGYRQSEWLHANGYFQYSGDATPAPVQPYVSNTLVVNVTAADPVDPEVDGWLPAIDFESDYEQFALQSGDVVTDQFAALGVHVTTNDPANHPAMIFNSSLPTGGDRDLGTPNQNFGGPGVGTGGENGIGANDVALGNILIISEDADASDPDDNYGGGTLIFTFDNPVMLDEIGLLDIDNHEATLRLLDSSGQVILTKQVNGQGNNSHQTVALNATGVSRLEVILTGSGAVTDLVFCRVDENGNHIEPVEPVTPQTKFYTVDGANDSGFQYDASGANLGSFDLVGGAIARGVTTTVSGNPVWVVKSNEWVSVYDRTNDSFLGEWDAAGPEWARGIATDGDDIWIVDAYHDRVYQYNGGAAWTGGLHGASSSFELNWNNRDPSGLAWHGDQLWVTDASSDRVFVYSQPGQHLGNWQLDGANGRSSGITTDASGNHLWVTDYNDGEIYYYENATGRRSGQQSATATIALAADNQRPEGIADPAIPINLDEVVTGTIATAGEQVEYTFNVTAGEQVYFDKISGGLFLGWSLVSPSGQSVFSSTAFSDVATTELTEDGTYLLTVGRTNGTTLGDFSFQLTGVPETTVETIQLDEVITSAMTSPGQQRTFEFDVTADERVYFDQLSGSVGFGWSLVSPSGQSVFSSTFMRDVGTTELTEDGTYVLTVGRTNGATIGNFSFQLADVPETTIETIQLDEVITSAMTTPGQQRTFEFDVTAGERVYFDQLSGTSGFGWSLISPSGQAVFSNSSFGDVATTELTEDGTYVLTVGRSSVAFVGDFSFQLATVPETTVETIAIDQTVTDELVAPGQQKTYTFAGQDGQQIYADAISGELGFGWNIVDQSGNQLFSALFQDRGVFTLTQDAVYTITVGTPNQSRTGVYSFRIWNVPAIVAEPIQYSQPVSDSILIPGQQRLYTFEGQSGQEIYLDFTNISRPGNPASTTPDPFFLATIEGPNGEIVSQRRFEDVGKLTLPATGTYSITLSQVQPSGRYESLYSFTLYDSSPVEPLTFQQNENVAATTNPLQQATYEFSATAGQDVVFDVRENVGDAVVFEIFDPTGASLTGPTRSDVIIGQLPLTGIYTILVLTDDFESINFNPDGRGDFSFRIQEVPIPGPSGLLDSEGTEFITAFTPAIAGTALIQVEQELTIRISGEFDTTAVVTVPSIGFAGVADVVAGQVAIIKVPLDAVPEATIVDGISQNSVRVVSELPISVHVLQDGGFTSEGFLAYPVDALGTDYLTLDYHGVFPAFASTRAHFLVVAAEDNTDVTITTRVDAESRVANVPFTITLNKGEVYRLGKKNGVFASVDLTGTSIVASKPVSVLSGSDQSFIPDRIGQGDMLVEQLPSIDRWGSTFYTSPLASRLNGDRFRFLAAEDNTVVTVNGAVVAQLDRGEFHEMVIDQQAEIIGSRPILVGQYAHGQRFDDTTGDPFFVLVNPVEQGKNAFSFVTGAQGIETHYVNVVIRNDDVAGLELNGTAVDAALFAPINGSAYSGAQIAVPDGAYRLTAEGAFTAIVYGFGSFDSYAYSAGTGLALVAEASSISLSPAQTSLLPGDTHTVTARVLDIDGNPLTDLRVDFTVTGANGQNGFVYTDADGNASYSWVGDSSGMDAVTAVVGGLFASAAVTFQAVQPSVTISTPDDDSEFAIGQSVILSGRATPGAADAEIVSVTVNGQPVDAFDAAGNYYAAVDVASGSNVYSVVATDRFGNTATAEISLTGVNVPLDITQYDRLQDNQADFQYARTTFNRSNNQLFFDYTLTATGDRAIPQGALVAIGDFNPPSIEVGLDSTGTGTTQSIDQKAFFVQTANIAGGGLALGQTSVATDISLANPTRQRFEIDPFLISRANSAPQFVSTPTTTASVGAEFQYTAIATDAENDNVEYSILSGPESLSIDAATGVISWTPVATDIANHSIEIQADDRQGGLAVQTFNLTVTAQVPANRAPVFATSPLTTFNLRPSTIAGQTATYEYQATAIDPENDTLVYALTQNPTGMSIDAATGLIQWAVTATELGAAPVTLTATDSAGNTTTQSFTLEIVDQDTATISGIVFEDANGDTVHQPTENGIGGRTVYLDANRNGQLDAGEVSQLTANDGAFAFTGLLAGSYTVAQVQQTGFEVIAPTSALGAAAAIDVLAGQTGQLDFANVINGITDQSAPTIISIAPLFVKVAQPYEYQVVATDADGDDLSYALLQAPAGATIDLDTGLIGWTPTADQQGSTSLVIQVDDGNGNIDVQSVALLVQPQFQAPVFTTFPDRLATIDEAFAYDADVFDPDMEAILFSLTQAPVGAVIDPDSGVIDWLPTNGDLGEARFTVIATDESGLMAVQSFGLEVRSVNTAPSFVSDPVTEVAQGAIYQYFALATDTEDTVRYSLAADVAGVTVSSQSGRVTFDADTLTVGQTVSYTVVATDERGLTDLQDVTVTITADTQAPTVSLVSGAFAPEVALSLGDLSSIQVTANDNVGVESIVLMVDGVEVPLDAGGLYEFNAIAIGIYTFTATATDAAGNSTTVSQRLRVIDPTDTTAPDAFINTPGNTDEVTYLTDIAATVTSDSDLYFWRVDFAATGSDDWQVIATGDSDLANEFVGVFDPTLLANGNYDIRIFAEDFSGNSFTISNTFAVTGDAKLGNFATQFTDLQVPLAGIPIIITRQYDTLNADLSQDFGYGWRLGIGDGDLRESVPVGEGELSGVSPIFGGSEPFSVGTRVFITTPEGRRVAFRFDPIPTATLLGTQWTPRFVSEDTDYTLEVPNVGLSQTPDGFFGLYLLSGFNYNPSEYTLVSRDQIRYEYDQFDGLQSISDRNGVTLEYRDDGIFSSTGESIQFIRDGQNRITQIIDPSGNPINYGYNAAGDLITYTDQVDNTTTFEYNADVPHFLERITGPRGNVLQEVQYDEDGRFIALVDALGNAVERTYDLDAQAFTQSDRLGNYSILEFDDRGNITKLTDANGNVSSSRYDDPANPRLETSITDPRGVTTNYEYDAIGNITLITELDRFTQLDYNEFNDVVKITTPSADGGLLTVTIEYDERGNRTAFINSEGERQTFANDAFGRVIASTDALGQTTELTYSNFSNPDVIRFADGSQRISHRNANGLVTGATNEVGESVTFTYDQADRPTSFIDALGNEYQTFYDADLVSRTVDPLGREWSFDYDDDNRLIRLVDPEGGIISRVYDDNGRLISETNQIDQTETRTYSPVGELLSFTNAAGDTVNYGYDAFQNLTSITDGKGLTTEYRYDAQNRLTKIIDALGFEEDYSYDIRDNITSITDRNGGVTEFTYDNVRRTTSSTDAEGGVVQWEYDDAGNQTRFIDERGYVTSYTYDQRNRVTTETDAAGFTLQWEYDLANRLTTLTDQTGNAYQFTYDANNRLSTTVNPLGGTIAYTYDAVGNRLSLTDEIGRITTNTFDSLDRVIASQDPAGATTLFEYDGFGNVLAITDSENNRTEYQYNGRNDVSVSIDPLGNSTTYDYDANRNLTSRTDRLGRTIDYSYDDLNRLVSEVWSSQTDSVVQTYSFSYDANNNLLLASGPNSQYAYTYDLLDRVTSVDNAGSPNIPQVSLAYQYDAASNLLETRDNSGVTVSASYDSRNLVSSFIWNGGGITDARVNYQYDGRGLLTSTQRFNDVSGTNLISQTARTRDSLGRTLSLNHLDSPGDTVASYQYGFDAAGQVIERFINGNGTSFTLDDQGQLISADNAVGEDETYVYDSNGNRVADQIVVGANNQLLADENFQYVYDAEGNLTRKTEIATGEFTVYEYDHRNRMTLAEKFSAGGILLSQSSFVFDAFNRLITRSVDSDGAGAAAAEITHTVYNGENAWVDFSGSGDVIARYLFGQGLDQNIARWRPGEGTAWYLTDQLGSVRDIVNSTGQVIDHIEYDSFGNILLETNPEAGDRFKFTGREWSPELGLYYYRARFYDPVTGRFVSQDPIGFAGADANLYRYVGNNPLSFTDPTGNIAIAGYQVGLKFSDLAISTATGLAGFAVGYVCGVLDAYFNHDPANGDFDLADVSGDILKSAVLGGVIGAGVGAIGATSAGVAAAPLFSQVFSVVGTSFALMEVASSQNSETFFLRAACFIAETATGAIIGRKFKRCFVAGTPVIIEQLEEEIDSAIGLSRHQLIVITVGATLVVVALAIADEKNGNRKKRRTKKNTSKSDPALGLESLMYFDDNPWTRLEVL